TALPIEFLDDHSGHIGSKTFIEPNILPRATSYFVAKPLVGEFVGDQPPAEPAHKRNGRVLHSAAPTHLAMPIFFSVVRIGFKSSFEKIHNRYGDRRLGLCNAQIFRINIMIDRESLGSASGHVRI